MHYASKTKDAPKFSKFVRFAKVLISSTKMEASISEVSKENGSSFLDSSHISLFDFVTLASLVSINMQLKKIVLTRFQQASCVFEA